MIKSKIQFSHNRPMINIDGELHFPIAYTTYFEECGEWSDFIKNGYKMFFVNVSFTDLPINNTSGFTPFRTGVFESERPDYSEFDSHVRHILRKCPDAFIFPRINVSMPRKWIETNPYETVSTSRGGMRESLYSDLFKSDGAKLLKTLVSHIRSEDYAHRIAGYQLCGGTTQEWMHHDLCGSFSEMGLKKFKEWAFEKYKTKYTEALKKEDVEKGVLTETIKKYYEFCNDVPPKTVEHFAKALKEFTNNEQIVGVFYGYSAYVCNPLWGLQGLSQIIDSPYIDFFSSPCCYDGNRSLGLDWGDMFPVDSVKLHKKLPFIECDIRTHLTQQMQNSRPGEYPDDILKLYDSDGNKTVWSGPDTSYYSISAIRKAFAHQITKGSGLWWFDMWGGWYHSREIMSELETLRKVVCDFERKSSVISLQAEVAVFIDEKAYRNFAHGTPLSDTVNNIRVAMGNTGIPFDMYMVEDAQAVLHKYKFAIFTTPKPSESGKKALDFCKISGIQYITSTEEKPFYSTNELRDILIKSGIHCYNCDNCVIYCGNGFLGVHTVSDGETKVVLPRKMKIRPFGGTQEDETESEFIAFTAPKHSTKLFELL